MVEAGGEEPPPSMKIVSKRPMWKDGTFIDRMEAIVYEVEFSTILSASNGSSNAASQTALPTAISSRFQLNKRYPQVVFYNLIHLCIINNLSLLIYFFE